MVALPESTSMDVTVPDASCARASSRRALRDLRDTKSITGYRPDAHWGLGEVGGAPGGCLAGSEGGRKQVLLLFHGGVKKFF